MAICKILVNSQAGLHSNHATPDQIRQIVTELQVDAEVVETSSPEDMCKAIREFQKRGIDRIAIAGGDGTIHAAVQCIAGTETTLAILPQGTRNNFAHALGLPLDLKEAVALLRDGRVVEADVGKVKGTYFVEAAGVGVFADILDLYGKSNKNLWRALYAIVKTFFTLRARRLRLTIDGEIVRERAVMCTVANSYRIGLGAPLAPGASVCDGLLDVVVLGDLTRFELLRYYRALQTTGKPDPAKIDRMRAKRVKIESGHHLSLHLDDRVVGTTPADIEVVPGALNVLVP